MVGIKSTIRGLLGTVGLTIITAGSAFSQTTTLQPPTTQAIDRNGVDLVTDQLSVPVPAISAGSNGSGIARSGSGWNLPFGDNFTGVINGTYGTTLTVTLGGSSEKFNWDSGTSSYVPETASPDTLSCNSTTCTYTLGDGTIASFQRNLIGEIGIADNNGAITQLTKPDGEVLTFYYKQDTTSTIVPPLGRPAYMLGLSGVTSSLGWMVKYEVATAHDVSPTKIYIVNTSVDYCDPTPTTASCLSAPDSGTWPMLTPGGTSGSPTYTQRLDGVSDPVTHVSTGTASTGGIFSVTFATGITSPTGVVESATFTSGATTVISITSQGQTWNYSHSAGTTTVTDPNGKTRIVTSSTTTGQVLTDTDELGRKTTYTYYTTTGSGALKNAVKDVIAPDATYSGSTLTGGYTEYQYDGRGNVTQVTVVPKAGSGLANIVTSATYPASCSTYPKTCNKPLTITDAAGNVTTFTYDDANSGQIASVTKPAVSGVSPKTTYTYSQITPYVIATSGGSPTAGTPVWRLTSTSSCITGATCIGGSASNELKTVISYGASNTNPTYHNVLPVSTTVARGDANLGNPASSTNRYHRTTYTYDNMGNLTSAEGPISGITGTSYFFYDAMHRRTGVIGADPDDTGVLPRQGVVTAYNASSQAISVIKGSVAGTALSDLTFMTTHTAQNKGEIVYDATTGLPTVNRFYPGVSGILATTPTAVVQTTYDSLLRVDCVAQRLNSSVFFPTPPTTLPTSACTPQTAGTDGPDRITKTTYDATSAPLMVISGYDVAPKIETQNTYDSTNGLLLSVFDDKGNLTSFMYDAFDRRYKTCYPNSTTVLASSTTDCSQMTFDAYGRVNSLTPRGVPKIDLAYDTNERLTSKTDDATSTILETFSYDNFSHIVSHFANSGTENYTYDALDGLTSDQQPLGASSATVNYTYDIYGRRMRLIYPPYSSQAFYVAYAYNNDNMLSTEKVSFNGGAENLQTTFNEDPYGRLGSLRYGPATPTVTTTPTYDSSSRLSSLKNDLSGGATNDSMWNYTYSAAQQILTRNQAGSSSYNYVASNVGPDAFGLNGLNQVVTKNATSFTYDAKGNLTSDGTTSYVYNAYNMLISSTKAGITTTFTYSPSNHLATVTQGGATSRFIYDGNNLIAEYAGSNTLQRRFVHGAGQNNPLVWYQGTDDTNIRYFTADQQGSITATTNSTGTVRTIYTYDEYGNPLTATGSDVSRFRFTGQVYIPEVDLYNYNARMYDAKIGRFLQTDPIGYGDGLNIYAYVHGDPVNSEDSLGLDTHCYNVQVEFHYKSDPKTEYWAPLPDQCVDVDDSAGHGYGGDPEARARFAAAAAGAVKFFQSTLKGANDLTKKLICGGDYYSLNVYLGPQTGVASGGNDFNITIDKYGHIYGAVGPYVSTGRGFDAGVYYLANLPHGNGSPSEEDIHSALSGMAFNIGLIGPFVGINVSVSADNPLAYSSMGLVEGVPGAGGSETIGTEIPNSTLESLGLSNAGIKDALDSACGR